MKLPLSLGVATWCVALSACSSTSSPATAADAGGQLDAEGTDAAVTEADAAPPEGACGAAPYVTVGVLVEGANASGPGTPVDGASFSSSLCPGVTLTTATDGSLSALVTKGVPFFLHIEALNYARSLTAETRFDADSSGFVIPMPPQIFTALIPGFAADKTVLVVGIDSVGASGACKALDGITVDIPGHPEAIVSYLTADTIPSVSPGTTTTASGRALVMGLAADQLVTVHGAKAGCTVNFARAPYTGRAPLAAGALTLVPGNVR